MITSEKNAFYNLCLILPKVIEDLVENTNIETPKDTVFAELKQLADTKEISIATVVFLL